MKINISSKKELHDFLEKNLLDKNEGAKITQQSLTAFDQSVKLGMITPFFKTKGKDRYINKLYFREELEEYAKTKRK